MPYVALVYVDNLEELSADQQFHRTTALAGGGAARRRHRRGRSNGIYRRYDNGRFLHRVRRAGSSRQSSRARASPLLEARAPHRHRHEHDRLAVGRGGRGGHARASRTRARARPWSWRSAAAATRPWSKTAPTTPSTAGRRQLETMQSRVKARLFAKALRQLFENAGDVVVMGHKNPDMDCLGAALGVAACAQAPSARARSSSSTSPTPPSTSRSSRSAATPPMPTASSRRSTPSGSCAPPRCSWSWTRSARSRPSPRSCIGHGQPHRAHRPPPPQRGLPREHHAALPRVPRLQRGRAGHRGHPVLSTTTCARPRSCAARCWRASRWTPSTSPSTWAAARSRPRPTCAAAARTSAWSSTCSRTTWRSFAACAQDGRARGAARPRHRARARGRARARQQARSPPRRPTSSIGIRGIEAAFVVGARGRHAVRVRPLARPRQRAARVRKARRRRPPDHGRRPAVPDSAAWTRRIALVQAEHPGISRRDRRRTRAGLRAAPPRQARGPAARLTQQPRRATGQERGS